MSRDIENIQDAFLNKIRQEGTEVTLNLMNGSRISGRISGFDKFAIIMENTNQQFMVFKHAISTINIVKRFRNAPKLKNASKKDK
jgi:host factor-I protein